MTDEALVTDPEAPDALELPQAPPIVDRFLFVDIAALRAKQLRRGATPRLRHESSSRPEAPTKAERIAMEEVRQRLVQYELPTFKSRSTVPQA
jgi:DNA-directed RNA polymerase subunit K/omega